MKGNNIGGGGGGGGGGRRFVSGKLWFVTVALAGLFAGAILIASFGHVSDHSLLCSISETYHRRSGSVATPIQLQAILHYATSKTVPQQSLDEIRVSFDVLKGQAPCNFLVFGLGHDSLMWAGFNPRGTTLFLEEDPKWVQTVLKNAPDLVAAHVKYPTQLQQADDLIRTYRAEPDCSPERANLGKYSNCRLALKELPDVVYEKEWDLIMIDAPRGYFAEAPGRMGAIFTATVMARARKRPGVTHVFLHDVDRRVEKMFAEEFLCKKYLVKAVGRIWHFEIPSFVNHTITSGSFC